ncbi:MAG: hypothetical protein LBG57_10280 [Treponema sp.]|jgi:hypothetical protein|nr:hypothetical protein [Treponema sp.]
MEDNDLDEGEPANGETAIDSMAEPVDVEWKDRGPVTRSRCGETETLPRALLPIIHSSFYNNVWPG